MVAVLFELFFFVQLSIFLFALGKQISFCEIQDDVSHFLLFFSHLSLCLKIVIKELIIIW